MQQSLLIGVLSLLLAACAGQSAPTTHPAPSFDARIDHVAISVSSVERSAAFYEDVFGLKELKNPFPGGGGVVWLGLGPGVAMHIFHGRATPVTDERERHLAITVVDMTRVTAGLAARGIGWQNFDGEPGKVQTRPDGVNQLFFRDLDGYWIEVNDALKMPAR